MNIFWKSVLSFLMVGFLASAHAEITDQNTFWATMEAWQDQKGFSLNDFRDAITAHSGVTDLSEVTNEQAAAFIKAVTTGDVNWNDVLVTARGTGLVTEDHPISLTALQNTFASWSMHVGKSQTDWFDAMNAYLGTSTPSAEQEKTFISAIKAGTVDWDKLLEDYRARDESDEPYVPPTEQENEALRDTYDQLQNELQGYENLWQELQRQIKNGDEIDWDGIGQQLGIPPTTPDDLLDRLNQLRNYNDVLNQQRSDSGFNTVEDFMRWYQGQIPDQSGKYCTGADQSCQQYDREKIDGIKSGPGKEGSRMINPDNEGKLGFVDVSEILSGLQQQIPSLLRLLIAISYITGIIFMVMAVMKLKNLGERGGYYSQQGGLTGILIHAVVGSMLVYFPTMVHVGTNTFMSDGGDFSYAYNLNATDFGYPGLVLTVVAIIRLVGYIAFFRGWLLLVKVGNGQQHQGSMSKGIVHMVGGILAVNIITTWEILRATFGYVW